MLFGRLLLCLGLLLYEFICCCVESYAFPFIIMLPFANRTVEPNPSTMVHRQSTDIAYMYVIRLVLCYTDNVYMIQNHDETLPSKLIPYIHIPFGFSLLALNNWRKYGMHISVAEYDDRKGLLILRVYYLNEKQIKSF